MNKPPTRSSIGDVAIIGMAGRFPGARDVAAFWQNLKNGVESIARFTDAELAAAGVAPELRADPGYVKARPVLDQIEWFDADFFGINPREAATMDPQQRLFLETAWQALEDAGYDSDRYAGAIGVFGALYFDTYLLANLCTNRRRTEGLLNYTEPGTYQTYLGNDKDYLASRVAYKLNLTGPAVTLLTACSGSLVAVGQACQSLLGQQCDMALAGGVTVLVPQQKGYLYQEGGMLSPDGRCRVFDAQAQGTLFGSGVALVVLKRLADALADGDQIYAVIKGAAVNNDGAVKVSYTAPSVDGQADVIALALALAGVSADTITYIEAHGTATPLGDPIEVAALTQAFRQTTNRTGFCGLGSLKGNVGHLDVAAGAAALIKTALALRHRLIPPTLHFTTPNPQIDFANSPFYVVAQPTEWPAHGGPRRAGVSAFGVGGTNAHVVLEEAPAVAPSGPSRPVQLLMLSAKTPAALEQATANLAAHLADLAKSTAAALPSEAVAAATLADMAYTLEAGRRTFSQRRIVAVRSLAEAVALLEKPDPKRVFSGTPARRDPPVVFLFPGQGAQQAGMGAELYEREPVFREAFDRCARLLEPRLGGELRALLADAGQLGQTRIAQPALFAIEYALARLWMSWGVRPAAMIGHSVGEYVAGCLAGVFALDDALRLVAERARLVQEQPPGAMLAVRLTEDEVRPLLGESLSLAAINAPSLCVVSGPPAAVAALAARLQADGKASVPLASSRAFHSAMIEPVIAPLTALLRQVRLQPPQFPYVSNVTAQWVTDAEATSPDYWAGHARQPVRFAAGLTLVLADPAAVLLEVGPGQTLSALARQHPACAREQVVLSSLGTGPEQESMQTARGRLWLAGVEFDPAAIFADERRRRVSLPSYPFQRQRHWIEPDWGDDAAERRAALAAERNGPADGSVASPPVPAREDRPAAALRHELRALLAAVSGREYAATDDQATLVELGFESLSLTQVTLAIAQRFGVRIAFRQLLGELGTIDALAAHLQTALGAPRPAREPAAASGAAAGPITTAPLTAGQREIWLAAMLDAAESCVFNQSCTLRLRGALRRDVLETALRQLVQRHDGLRTTFSAQGDVQTVAPQAELTLVTHDLSGVEPARREAQFEQILAAEAARPFDLAQAPLLRAQLLKFQQHEHVLVLTAQHIVCSGEALGLLFHELGELYSAGCRGETAVLPPARSLLEFARAETAAAAGPEWKAAEAYWLGQYTSNPPALELPADFPRPATRSYRGAAIQVVLPPVLAQQLRQASARQGGTLFTFLLAAYYLLLERLTGQADVVVGVPMASPSAAGEGALVGHTVNFLAVRAALDDRLAWREHVQRVKQVVLDAYDHRQFTYGSLISKLKIGRDRSRLPLVAALFNLAHVPRPKRFTGLEVAVQENPHSYTNVDLAFDFTAVAGGLQLDCIYNVDLFAPPTIRRWLGHFQTLLAAVVAQPDGPLAEVPLLTAAEREQLAKWNDTRVEYPTDVCLQQLLEAQAAQTPEAVAVVFADQSLTYRELEARANQLARHLQSLGVTAENFVGVCLERSLEMVVALVATLKAGAAYVPIDPTYPADRVAFMLGDANPPVLLTQARLLARLPATAARVVAVDRDRAAIARHPVARPAATTNAGQLAYMIYTSGSTGKPKGALNTHRGIVNRLLWMQDAYRLGPEDRVLQKTPFSFDVSVWEFFWPLLSGARLVVARPEGHRDSAYLVRLIQQQQITTLHFVPSMLAAFLAEDGVEACRSLRRVICSGEALPPELPESFFQRLPAVELHNLYGPTEAAVDVSAWACRRGRGLRTVPIGRPIANIRLHILDARLHPVPVGVAGELHIGGVGVGRGYHQRAELTAAKFIPDPFSNAPGARLYKTGDLARYLPDGNIEYLGRLDHQVKIRGFRIELGEIEAALAQHPAVREAVVLARADSPGDKRLAAYIVAQTPPPSASELREHLKRKLPEYMLPAAFVFLAALPLSPNGKVDRQALPAPAARVDGPTPLTPPRTGPERVLAELWRELLRLPAVGVQDNFFALGGDSILAIQIVARARRAGLQLTPIQFFQHQTIAELAAAAAATTVAAGLEPVLGPVALTPIQEWLFADPHRDRHHWNQAVMLEPRQPLEPRLLPQAFGHLLRHHDALRLRFVPAGDGWRQQLAAADEEVPFGHVGFTALPPADQAAAIATCAAEAQASLNVTTGPLLRAVYFDRGAGRPGRLLIVIHHLVVDGVSWRILVEDLETVYRQLRQGQPLELPAKTTSFGHWAAALRQYATTPALAAEAAWWQQQGQAEPAALPLDHAADAAANTEATTRTVRVALGCDETRALLQEMPAAYRTQINDVLLTALAQTLAGWTGARTVRLDLEGHGREPIAANLDLSRTVGWFTSLFPVRLELPADDGPGAALRSVKEQLRRIPARGIGYGVLRYLAGDSVLQAQPPAAVAFNYLGQIDAGVAAAACFALTADPVGPTHGAAGRRPYVLEINARVSGGQLWLDWQYSEALHERGTVVQLAERFFDHLRALLTHCQMPRGGRLTPADFPLAKLDERTLERLSAGDGLIEDIYPALPMQRLFLTLADSTPGIGIEQFAYDLEGDLDPAALQDAWQRVVDRHPILRTQIEAGAASEPLQIVRRRALIAWETRDWRSQSPAEQQQRWPEFLRADRQRGLALAQPPLMRLSLIRLSDRRYRFLWTNHHVILDGWSWPIVLQEVAALYQARCRGHDADLAPVRPYRDYVAWYLQQDLAAAEVFWRRQFEGLRAPARLGRPDDAGRGRGHAAERVTVPAEVLAGLSAVARQHRLTLNTLVQGAWVLTVSRWCGAAEVLFAAAMSGRPAEVPGIETMVGLFINNLPVRVRVRPAEDLVSWLAALQQTQAEMRRYEFTPPALVQEWSGLPGRQRLCESLVVFQNYTVDESSRQWLGAAVRVQALAGELRTNFPLTLLVSPADGLRLHAAYHTQEFAAGDVSGLLGNLQTLLTAIAANPQQSVGAVRGLLPEPRPATAARDASRPRRHPLVAPRDPVETHLVDLWERLLGLAPIGVTDNFFELGGESLLAVRLAAQVETLTGHRVPLATLSQSPTIAQLAAVLRQQGWPGPGAETQDESTGVAARTGHAAAGTQPPALSFSQERLWFLDQFEPNSAAYNIPLALRLSGSLDVPALERCLAEILRRHAVLRTHFDDVAGKPVPRLEPPGAWELPVVDLTGCAADERLAVASRQAEEDAHRPFVLARDRKLRATLYRLEPTEHLLTLTLHHIAADGWSIDVLFRELTALYEAYRHQRPSPLPELPMQYADFAVWQRAWLQGDVLQRQLDYWRQRLAQAPAVLELPADRPRPAVQTFRGRTLAETFPLALANAVQDLSRREGVSVFMTLLAVFELLLHRYCGQEDILIGTPVACRTRPEIEGLIGFFVNTVVMRADLSGHPSFQALLGQVRAATLEALTHQELPFEKLVEELQPERNLAHSPLFQVMFIDNNHQRAPSRLAGLAVTPLPVTTQTAKFDLTLAWDLTPAGLSVEFEYNTDLFAAATITRLFGHYRTLLEGVVARPDAPIETLPLLTAAERQQVLVDWNATALDLPPDTCLHQLVEAQAAQTPAAVAVVHGAEQLTYRELEARADRLAAHLRSLGVAPGRLVGLCVERSPAMVVGLLAILKAGGAYLPLDPDFPAARLAFMIQDAQPVVRLTQQNLASALPPHSSPVVCLDAEPVTVAEPASRTRPQPDDLAYVLYTSGSTGQPKGVQISHRAVVNFLTSMRREPGLSASDVLLAVTTLSFDIAGLELFLPLTTGARVVIASRAVATDGMELARLLRASGATVMQATPATWRLLLAAGWEGEPGLKALCGGEALPADLAEQLLPRCGALWNMYGPTETTIWSAVSRVLPGQPVRLGRPIANTTFYVVDPQLQPVPVGVPGELLIGGAGVARGYLNRPELTAERFIPDPFSSRPGARLYRTGDRVRRSADGTLEFLGRLDHQVKLRGYRIELGEIETILKRHPAVREAVVVAREDGPGDQRLVAYMTQTDGQRPEAITLRELLAATLPEYMVPSAFVVLERLPLTPNGKIDRQALPVPDSAAAGTAGPVAPRTPVEEQLAGIWAEVLRAKAVGRDDNFFALGGHSLLAVQVVSRVRDALAVPLPLTSLFECPTVSGMAEQIERLLWIKNGNAATAALAVTMVEGEL